MGTNGSKGPRSPAHHHHHHQHHHPRQPLDERDSRTEQLRRYLQEYPSSPYLTHAGADPSSAYPDHGGDTGYYRDDVSSQLSQPGSRATFYYPTSPIISRSQSEHNIVYREHAAHTAAAKPKDTISKRITRWMRRIGGKDKNSPRGQRYASETQIRDINTAHGRHRLLSKSDSGLDNDLDSVSLVRSEATYQDLETPRLSRRYGSCDVLREENSAQSEFLITADGVVLRPEQPPARFVQNRPSPALPSRHWSKRRPRAGFGGTCRSEPAARSAFQVGQSYQIPLSGSDGDHHQQGYNRHRYFNSVPGHFHSRQTNPHIADSRQTNTHIADSRQTNPHIADSRQTNPHIADVQQTQAKQPYTSPPLPCPPPPTPQGSTQFINTAWGSNAPQQQQQQNQSNFLRTVSESENSFEIYNSTVDRKTNDPTFQNKSLFVANRSKSASTGCLSQADSGVGQDWMEYEKSMDFDDDNTNHFSVGGSYERIADFRPESSRREIDTQTTSTTDLRHGHSCPCQSPVIKHYHNCTFIVNPKGLQVGNRAQMHYNSLPQSVQDMCSTSGDDDDSSDGVVNVEYEVQEIPSGTIV